MRYLIVLACFLSMPAITLADSQVGEPAPIILSEKLIDEVAAKRINGVESCRVLRAAADAADPKLIPALRKAAAVWGADPVHLKVSFYALHALWTSGESTDYFLKNLDAGKENKWLVYNSILILARNPDQKVLDRIKRMTPHEDVHIQGAISAVGAVRTLIDEYDRLREPEERIDFVLQRAGSTWNALSGANSDPIDERHPHPFWARRELTALCKTQGALVAQRLRLLPTDRRSPDPQDWQEIRDYTAQFLTPEVRREYEKK